MAIIEVNRKKPYKVVIRIHNKQKSKLFARKIDAQSWEREMLTRREKGEPSLLNFTSAVSINLNELRERFLREYAQHRQAASTRSMESTLYSNYVSPVIGEAKIEKLRKIDVQNLFVTLAEKYKLKNGQINRIRQILSCMFSQAVERDMLEFNPVASIRKLPERNHLKEEALPYISQEEARSLLVWLERNDPWLYPKVRVLLNTGIRYGEMCALKSTDLVRGSNGWHLKVSRTFCRYTKEIKDRTKGGRSRMIPLSIGMGNWLETLTRGKSLNSPLLWESLTECRHHTKFAKHYRKALNESGVNRIRVHDLRHTFAVHFLEQGGQLYDLQKLLGHQSYRLTERYSHFSIAMSERTRGRVDHGATLTVIDGGKPDTMLHKCCTNDVFDESKDQPLVQEN